MIKRVLLILIFFLTSCSLPEITKVCFEKDICVDVEVMDEPAEHAKGLMGRSGLDETEGMLFIFEYSGEHLFWMKNMKFPIDMIFVDHELKIVHIEEKVPPCTQESCDVYGPKQDIKYVVEVISGFANMHDIKEGQKIFFK